MLPGHARWATFLRGLRYVVVDECHGYRGVFGSHVAQVLRRLRRVLRALRRHTHVDPGVGDRGGPGQHRAPAHGSRRRRGRPRRGAARQDRLRAGPAAADPLKGENGAPARFHWPRRIRRTGWRTLSSTGCGTLSFVRLLVRRRGDRRLRPSGADLEQSPDLADRVAVYRSEYLPEDRRMLKAALRTGELLGMATTNALKLGVDVSGLEAVLLTGYPGTLASLCADGTGDAGRLHGVSRADAACLSHPHNLGSGVLSASAMRPALPTWQSPADYPRQPTGDPPGWCDHKARRPAAVTRSGPPLKESCPPVCPLNGTGRRMAAIHKQGQSAGR